MLSELEGLLPALETSHAVWGAIELAKTMPKDEGIVICLSGREIRTSKLWQTSCQSLVRRLDGTCGSRLPVYSTCD